MSDFPVLDFRVHWCTRHLEPFRIDWPDGAAAAMLELFKLAVADQRIVDACPKTAEGLAKAEALDGVLRDYAPLCCFIGDEQMESVYHAAEKACRACADATGGVCRKHQEPECTCYEIIGGHQQGCRFYGRPYKGLIGV